MFSFICRGIEFRRLRSRRDHLVLAAILVGLRATVAPAQPAPGGGAAVTTAPASQPSQPVPEAALQAIAASRYADAVAILEPLAKSDSAGFDVLIKLAGSYEELARDAINDRTPAGRGTYDKGSKKAVEYYVRASRLAQASGDPRTESILRHILQYDPQNASALLSLAKSYEKPGPAAMAIYYYREYVKTPAGQADAASQVALGRLLVSQQLWHQAVDVLDKAKAVAGAEAEQQLALAYLAGRQADKAMDAADRAVNSPQHTAEAFMVRSTLYLQLGERADPRKALDDALTAARVAREMIVANPADETLWDKLDLWQQGLSRIAERAAEPTQGGSFRCEYADRAGPAHQ